MTAPRKAPHARSAPRRRASLLPFALLFAAGLHAQALPDNDGPLQPNHDTIAVKRGVTNDTIVRMSKAGLDDAIILQTIDLQPGHYDVTPDDLIALKQAGVSTPVIAAVQAKAAGLPTHGLLSRNLAETDPATVPQAPDEIGIYYKDKTGAWVQMKVERVEFKSGGWVKSAFTHNIIKEDKNGLVDAPHSPLTLPRGVEVLIYAPEGTAAEEYNFLRFREHSDSREFRVYTGGVFHNESGADRDALDFDAHRIAPRMYTFTVPRDIEKGEYGVLPPASSNAPGFAGTGKIFTFRIVE